MRRTFIILAMLLAAALSGCHWPEQTKPLNVLFIGNSLTYVGNLPAVTEALATANDRSLHAGMIVKGGATLTQWLDSGVVQRALKTHHYDYVVLQERGNDFACGFGPKVCRDSRHALHALTGIVRVAGAKPILLGTYEPDTEGSAALVDAESKAARANDTPYIAVSERLRSGRIRFPHADWFWKDGMHPGSKLVLLESVLLFRQFYGVFPVAQAFVVNAPIYVPGSKFSAPSPISVALPSICVQQCVTYSRGSVEIAITLARSE